MDFNAMQCNGRMGYAFENRFILEKAKGNKTTFNNGSIKLQDGQLMQLESTNCATCQDQFTKTHSIGKLKPFSFHRKLQNKK